MKTSAREARGALGDNGNGVFAVGVAREREREGVDECWPARGVVASMTASMA